jgi:hypothetical protein
MVEKLHKKRHKTLEALSEVVDSSTGDYLMTDVWLEVVSRDIRRKLISLDYTILHTCSFAKG